MKYLIFKRSGLWQMFVSVSFILCIDGIQAAPIYKANNSTDLSNAISWVGGVVPGSEDTVVIDDALTTATSAVLGENMEWHGIQVLNPAGPFTILPTTNATLTIDGGGIDMSEATQSLTNDCPIALGGANIWDVTNLQTLTFNGAVNNNGYPLTFSGDGDTFLNNSFNGSGTLIKTGHGTVTLSGTNSGFTGSAVIGGGTLSMAYYLAMGDGSYPVSLVTNWFTLDGGTFQSAANVYLSPNWGLTLTTNGGLVSIVGNDVFTEFQGGLSGAGTLTKIGSGTMYLDQDNTNFTGSVIVKSGTFCMDDYWVLGNGSFPSSLVTNWITLDGGAFESLGSVYMSPNWGFTMTTNGGAINVANPVFMEIQGGLNGAGTLTKTGTGTVYVDSADVFNAGAVNGFTGPILARGGTLWMDDGQALGDGSVPSNLVTNWITLDGGTLGTLLQNVYLSPNWGFTLTTNGGAINVANALFMEIQGGLNGAGTLTNVGAGTLYVDGINTGFTGQVVVNAGTLCMDTDLALGSPPSSLVTNQITINGGALQSMVDVVFNPNQGFALGTNGGTLDTSPYAIAFEIDGPVSGCGPLNINNGGKVILTGANTYTGATTINTGTLALSGSGSIVNSASIQVAGGATFDISGLSSTLTMGNLQTLEGPGTATTGTINAGNSAGLTLGGKTILLLPYFTSTTPALNITGGTLALNDNPVTVTVNNGGTPLPIGSYLLISANNNGSIVGTPSASVIVNGDGIPIGTGASLVISNSQLYLQVGIKPVIQSQIMGAGKGNVTITWSAMGGITYQVQYTDDLNLKNWTVLGNIVASGDTASFTDSTAPVVKRFYRVVAMP